LEPLKRSFHSRFKLARPLMAKKPNLHTNSLNKPLLRHLRPKCVAKLCDGSPIIQGVPELAPQRKQACADNKRDSKLTKINFLLAQITEL
jgi:hypothetical protein